MPDTAKSLSYAGLRSVRLLLPLLLLVGFSIASAADEPGLSDAMLEFVGLTAQVQRSAATIIDETAGARQACEGEELPMQDLAVFLKTLYAPEALHRSALAAIDEKLSVPEKTELHDWMQSALGQKVYHAEAATENEEMASMQQREKALIASSGWTEERQKRIYRVLRVTRVHDYVAALNASLTSVVKMASACQRDSVTLDAIEIAIRRDRVDEKLVGRMMLPGFVVPTGVVFEALSDEELHEYFLFSATPVAQKWYGAVIDTVRSILLERVPALRQFMQRG